MNAHATNTQRGYVSFDWVARGLTAAYAFCSAVWITLWNHYFIRMLPEHLRAAREPLYGAKDWLFVLVTSVVLYYLLRAYAARLAVRYPPARELPDEAGEALPMARWTAIVFAMLGIALSITGYTTFSGYRQEVVVAAMRELSAIAKLRADETARWVLERKRDARSLTEDPAVASTFVATIRADNGQADVAPSTRSHLDTMARVYGYKAIRVIDSSGEARLTAPLAMADVSLSPFARKLVHKAIRTGEELLDGSASDSISGRELGLAVPFARGAGSLSKLAGAVYLELKPELYLFPLLRTWPIPSETGEIVLLRRDEDKNQYAFEPLHKSAARRTQNADSLLQTLRGDQGVDGARRVDYRGEEVFMAARPVPGTPWTLIAKEDVGEVESPLNMIGMWAAVLVLSSLVAGGIITLLIWRNQEARFIASRYRARLEREALAKHFDYSTKHARDIVLFIDEGLHLLECNDAAGSAYGYSRDELLELDLRALRAPEARAGLVEDFKRGAQPDGVTFETVHQRKDGSTFPVEASVRLIEIEGRPCYHAIYRNISERKAHEHEASIANGSLQEIRAGLSRAQLMAKIAHVVTGPEGEFLSWSESLPTLIGLEAHAMPRSTRDWLKLLHPEDREKFRSKAIESGRTHLQDDLEYRLQRADNEWIHFRQVMEPLERGTAGAGRTRWFNTLLDVSEQKRSEQRLRESEERLNFALHMIHTGGWDLDLVDHTAHRTLEHDRIFGYGSLLPQWTYEMFLEHVLPEDRAEVDRCFRAATAAQSVWSFECRIRRVDGEVRWIWATGEHQRDEAGQARRMAGVVQDITERKRAEQEIRDLNASLERRVAERTQQLEASNMELESFSYSVSHDLRAPLRAIDGFSRIVQDDYAGKLDVEGLRLLGVIRDSTQKMGQLIDDLLEYSRLGRKPLSTGEIDMKRLVEEVLGELQTSGERSHGLALAALPPARGDATLLKQAWTNLLANAVKFSGKRGEPVIEVSGHESGVECVYCVKDNGAGFDMRYYEKLFEVFQRLHREEEFEGTGVGLAIVRRVVSRHGGRVWAEGKVDEGAAFYFSLPKGGGA